MKKDFFANAVVSREACTVEGCDSLHIRWIFVTLFKLQDEFDKWQVSTTNCNVKQSAFLVVKGENGIHWFGCPLCFSDSFIFHSLIPFVFGFGVVLHVIATAFGRFGNILN